MLPAPEKFVSRMRKMGIGDGDKVVVYDDAGMYSAPRAWWMFRVMGHDDVSVLDGGLPKWKSGRPARWRAIRRPSRRKSTSRRGCRPISCAIWTTCGACEAGGAQIVDARSPERFHAIAPEPRPTAGRATSPAR